MLAFINIIYYTYYCQISPKQHGRQWSLMQSMSAAEGGLLNGLEGRENKICIFTHHFRGFSYITLTETLCNES